MSRLESARNVCLDVQSMSTHCWNKLDRYARLTLFARIAGFLVAYADVLSCRDDDVRWTEVMEHSISLLECTQSFKQLLSNLNQGRIKKWNAN